MSNDNLPSDRYAHLVLNFILKMFSMFFIQRIDPALLLTRKKGFSDLHSTKTFRKFVVSENHQAARKSHLYGALCRVFELLHICMY